MTKAPTEHGGLVDSRVINFIDAILAPTSDCARPARCEPDARRTARDAQQDLFAGGLDAAA